MGSTLLLEIVTMVCAFILPRLIMVSFGSEYNGIVSSVSQFLSFITLLRGGIGGVTKAALYKPLLENDVVKISGIVKATENFMRKVCYIFIVFLVAFAAIYPLIIKEEFGWLYTFTLVLILGISTIAQYYFGITYQFLTQADQKQYIYNVLQIGATIVNTALSVVLIRAGLEFRLVKLSTALVFGAIPVLLYFYVHRHYTILKDIPPDTSAINQRWDAFAHQVAAFIHSNTDLVILTVFSDLFQVAIYTVYFMVTNGIKKFVNICSSGIESAIGNLLARKNQDKLSQGIDMYEWLINVVSTSFFTCTAVLIVPFVMVYTRGVTDTDYYQPLLGYLMCIAQFMACVRLPYQNAVEGAGRFKDTRNGAIAEAAINLITTIPLVIYMGCAGAVIGTIAATGFRTVQYAFYASKNIIHRPFGQYIKRMMVSALNIAIVMVPYFVFGVDRRLLIISSYLQWLVYAVAAFALIVLITVIVNWIFYSKTTIMFFKYALGRSVRKR